MDSGRHVTSSALFCGFARIGLLGFGGIAPWARRVIVEERGWMDDGEWAALLGIGQVLPGPNTMNAAVMLGDRYQGAIGAMLCLAGLVIGTALKMLRNVHGDWTTWAVVAAVFVAVAVLHLPLVPVVATSAPLGMALAARWPRA